MPANPAPTVPQYQSQTPTLPPVPQTPTVQMTQPVAGQHQASYPTGVVKQQVLPTENNSTDLIDIADENEGETLIGRNFYCSSTGKAFLIGFVLFTVFPVILSVILAYFGGCSPLMILMHYRL